MLKEKVISVDIGGSKIRIRTVDRDGNLGTENSINIFGLDIDNAELVKLLSDSIQQAIDKEPDAIAISIGAPGQVGNGVIEILPNLKNIKELHIADELKKIFKIAVYLVNDADAAGLGEAWRGAGKDLDSMVMITLGTGVGSSIITNGRLKSKTELGHTPLAVEDDNRECSCGKQNCAEAYLGTEGLVRTYAKIFNIEEANMTPEDKYSISFKMREGTANKNPDWLKMESEYIKHLVLFLKNIILAHHPDAILLGGGIAYNNNDLIEKTKDELMSATASSGAPPKAGAAALGEVWLHLAKHEEAGILGAARFAFDSLQAK